MKKSQRYKTSHLIEDQFEPGSRGRVLRNKLGITSAREMDKVEREAQLLTLHKLTEIFNRGYRFSAADICKMHKIWLGEIY